MRHNESFDWKGFYFFSTFSLSLIVVATAAHYGSVYVAAVLWPIEEVSLAALPTAIAKEPVLAKPDSLTWREVIAQAAWEPRDSAATFVFNGRMWVMGGLNGNGVESGPDHDFDYSKAKHFADIWSSADGTEWRQESSAAQWSPRRSMTVIEFKGQLVMLGGWSPLDGYKSDVWVSQDGANWSQALARAPWPAREGHTLDIWQDKLWLVGGVNYQEGRAFKDVWYSDDGVNWSQAPDAPWTTRWDHGTAVFGDRLFVTGGMLYKQTFGDVWSTKDGKSWERMPTPPWRPRQGHHAVAANGTMYVIGRLNDDTTVGPNDLWYTNDGIAWHSTDDPPWLGREDHGVLLFNDRLWVLGGMDKNWHWQSDVWQSTWLSVLEPPALSAKAALVTEFGATGERRDIYSYNVDQKLPVASLTKLMTGLVASELFVPRDVVEITTTALESKGLSGFYKAGDRFYVEDALYALLVASHNELARALAQKAGEEYFVARMNERAGLLGLADTHFVNASGLDEGSGELNHSSARDIAVLLRYIYEQRPELFAVLATPKRLLNKADGTFVVTLATTNKLMDSTPPLPVLGGKTGETPQAGQNLAIIAQQHDKLIVSVVIGSENNFADTRALLRYTKDSEQ